MQTNPEYQLRTSRDAHIPKVSIGMPVYNGEKYIREALDSVLAQTYTDLELVISDNTSTDGTEAICREYMSKDTRIKYIKQPINIGACNNFNYLLKHARGNYFTWLAHDDYLDSSFLEVIVRYLDEHNDVVLCSGDVKEIENGVITRNVTLDVVRDHKNWAKARRSLFTFSRNNLILIYGVYRLSIMQSYNIYVPHGFRGRVLLNGGESAVLSKVALHGRIVALPNVLRTYRIRHDSFAHKESINTGPLLRIINVIYVSYKYHFLVVVFSKLTIRQKMYAFFETFFYDTQDIIKTIIFAAWTSLPGRWRRSLLRVKCLHALRERIVHPS